MTVKGLAVPVDARNAMTATKTGILKGISGTEAETEVETENVKEGEEVEPQRGGEARLQTGGETTELGPLLPWRMLKKRMIGLRRLPMITDSKFPFLDQNFSCFLVSALSTICTFRNM